MEAKDVASLVFEISKITQSLWTLHMTVVLAAVGWGVTSRGWKQGLSWPVCLVVFFTLLSFFAFNLGSLNTFYIRANAALEFVRNADWGGADELASEIFAPVGKPAKILGVNAPPFLLIVAALDVIVAAVVATLLSRAARKVDG